MGFEGNRTVECDVLVVGSGIAGMRAAIQARKYGLKVTLVEKGLLGRCGETAFAGGGIGRDEVPPGFAQPLKRTWGEVKSLDDEILQWISSDTWVGRNAYIRDQKLAEIIVTEQYIRQDELQDYGVEHPRSSSYFAPANRGGSPLVLPLVRYARKAGIETWERTVITDLVRIGDSVAGAIGFNLGMKEFVTFRAKSTILATGGMGEAYERNNVPKGITGDGYAMALRAGAELQDMEFQEWDRFILDEPGLPHYWMHLSTERDTGELRNAREEPFFDGYMKRQNLVGPDATLRPEDPWEIRFGGGLMTRTDDMVIAMALEVNEGRGDKGSVLLDYSKAPIDEASWQTLNRSRSGRYLLRDFPWKEKRLHVFPGALSTYGGLRANEWCETNLKGLYAAGEVAAGGHKLHHANIFGVRGGTRAAEYARSAKLPEFTDDVTGWIESKRRMMEEILSRGETPEGEPKKLREEIRSLMWRNVGVLRTKEGLENAVEELRRMRRENLPKLYAKNFRELRKAVEIVNMVDAGEATARAALYRTETRGLHHRLDCPERDDAKWIKNVVVRLEDGELRLETKPVVMTRFYPPKEYRRRLW